MEILKNFDEKVVETVCKIFEFFCLPLFMLPLDSQKSKKFHCR